MVEKTLKSIVSAESVVPSCVVCRVKGFVEYREFHKRTITAYGSLWEEEARRLVWERMWDRLMEGEGLDVRWFVGGRINAYKNIIERHRESWIWHKPAVIWEGEDSYTRIIDYSEYHEMVLKACSALRGLGVSKGDWVVLYAQPTPEVLAFTHACIRLGLPFEFIFTGFGILRLRKAIMDRKPRVIIVSDSLLRRGRALNLKANLDNALKELDIGCKVIVVPRVPTSAINVELKQGRDFVLDEVPRSDPGEAVIADSNDILFGMHVGYDNEAEPLSHSVGGYLVQTYATTRWMDIRHSDTVFCTVWPGWITAMAYMLLGPFMMGSTLVIYEGGPDYPNWGRWWGIIEKYGVTVFITTAGAFRALSQHDEYVDMYNLESLRIVYTTAEPFDKKTWEWAFKRVCKERIPLIHMYIQSEIGTFAIGGAPAIMQTPLKPGSTGTPLPGFDFDVVDEGGRSVRGVLGMLILRNPWPAMPIERPRSMSERLKGGVYYTGDYAVMDDDGVIFVALRSDAVMKVNGYRLSPGELEGSIEGVLKVRRCIVAGMPDPQRFEAPLVIVEGRVNEEDVRRIIRSFTGPIADPGRIIVRDVLPEGPKDELRLKLKRHLWGLERDSSWGSILGE